MPELHDIALKPEEVVNPESIIVTGRPLGSVLENFSLQSLTPSIREDLYKALQTFPEDKRKIPEAVPNFQAVVLSPEGDPDGADYPGDVSFVFMPGVTGTAAGTAQIASEVYRSTDEKLGKKIGFSATISSSGSVDTANAPFAKDPWTRAIPQAGLIAEIVSEHPTKELVFLGHSLGALETPYVVVLVEQLLKDRGIDTKVAGIILENPGGQYKQSFAETAKGFATLQSMKGEVAESFPSWKDIFAAQEALENAGRKGDVGEVMHRQRVLNDMRKKLENLEGIPLEKQEQVGRIDDAMYNAWMSNEERLFEKLARDRHDILKPEVESYLKGAESRTKVQPSLVEFAPIGLSVVFGEANVNTPLPEWIRAKIHVPVALMWSGRDVLFPDQTAKNRMASEELDRRVIFQQAGHTDEEAREQARYLPNSPLVIDGTLIDQSHIAYATNPKGYSDMVTDVFARIQAAREDPSYGQSQKKMSLTY